MMIKNIVFDVGKVLADFCPLETCRKYSTSEQDAQELLSLVFLSPEWVFQDMGLYTEEHVIETVSSRTNNEHLKESIRLCFENWTQYSLPLRKSMFQLARDLHSKGYKLYILSNAPRRMAKMVGTATETSCFEGMLFSSDVMYIKPQPEIYRIFFEKFSLDPKECFFIDDLQVNIDGARSAGMNGHCFVDEEQLRKCLAAIL